MTGQRPDGDAAATEMVVRRAEHGWLVGGEVAADLTSAMVLADLLAAEAARPAVTVAQLEHARGREHGEDTKTCT